MVICIFDCCSTLYVIMQPVYASLLAVPVLQLVGEKKAVDCCGVPVP